MKTRAFFIAFAITLLPFFLFAQKMEYADSVFSCSYETENGIINGKYVSFYPNGQKKAEGNFENNYRIGLWTLWDKDGKMLTQRNYKNPFVFEQKYPEIPDNPSIKLLNQAIYEITYNDKGYIDYFEVTENVIVWSKRLWRFISKEDNKALLGDDLLFHKLHKAVMQGAITAYAASSDDFMSLAAPSDINIENKEFVGFKIKEDWFFDNERLVTEVRPLGICPVVKKKGSDYTMDLYWLYYPELRNILAKTPVANKNISSSYQINNFDDVFFFRCFQSEIYKESNIYDKQIKDYKVGEDIKKEAEAIALRIIEAEHDIWLRMYKE